MMSETHVLGSTLLTALIFLGVVTGVSSGMCTDVAESNVSMYHAVTDGTRRTHFVVAHAEDQLGTAATESNFIVSEYQRWIQKFDATELAPECNDPNVEPNRYGRLCAQAGELESFEDVSAAEPTVASSSNSDRDVEEMIHVRKRARMGEAPASNAAIDFPGVTVREDHDGARPESAT